MGMKFMAGASVEVRVPDEHCSDIWFPATILKEIEKDVFLVEYNSLSIDDEEYLQDNVDALNIRPFPPITLVESFDVFERVDAFYDFGWWNGVVLEVLARDADREYMVCFEHEPCLKKLEKFQLRRHMEWMNGQWLEDSLDMGMEHEQSDVHRTDNLHTSPVGSTSNTTIACKSYKRKRDIERNANNTICQLSLQTAEEEEASRLKKRGTCQKLAGCLSSPSNELSAPPASVHDKSCSNQKTIDLSKPALLVKGLEQKDSSKTLVKCSQIPDSHGSTRDLDSEENEKQKEVLEQQAATSLKRTIKEPEEPISESADGGPNVHNSHVEIPRLSEELSGPPTSISPENIEIVLDRDDKKEGETGDVSRVLIKCSQNLELQDSMVILGSSQDIGMKHEQSDVHRTHNLHTLRVTKTSNTIIASESYKRNRDIERNTNNTICQLSLQTTEEEEASRLKKRGTCQKLAGCLSSPSNELSAPPASVHDKSCSNQNTIDLSKPSLSVKATEQNDSSRTVVKCSQVPDSQGSTRDLDSEENEQHKEVLEQQAATSLKRTIDQSEELISEPADGVPKIPRSSEELSGPPTSFSLEKIETVLDRVDQKEGETGDSSKALIKHSQNLELQDSVMILGSRQEFNLDTIKSHVATSIEKFGVVSQAPHFQQLQHQPKCFHVGRAIGYKLSYLDLIDNVKTSQIHEPKIKLEKKLEALLKLETLGFDVQLFKSQVIEMITLKDGQVQVEGMLKKYKEQRVETKQCSELISVELKEDDERVREINEKMLETSRNLKAVEMEKKKKCDRVSALQRRAVEIEERVDRNGKEFSSVAALPL